MSARGHFYTPAVHCNNKRYTDNKMTLYFVSQDMFSYIFGSLKPLTHSEDTDEFNQRGGSYTRGKERLHDITSKRQGHIRSNRWSEI